jgi:hypothetical protein
MAAPRPVSIADPDLGEIRFTIGTLVTDHRAYCEMTASFEAGGFSSDCCEYLFIDNSGATKTSASDGLRLLLDEARGVYVVLCHQDVRLLADGRAMLERRLAELDDIDPNWALAGNAGGVRPGVLALRITDPHGCDRRVGGLPERVSSLDENFILVKRRARIGLSRDLTGFHLYGADLCLVADLLGYNAYVIDFHLEHLSAGKKDGAYRAAEAAFAAKWSRALRSRWIQTTCSLIGVAGNPVSHALRRAMRRPLAAGTKRLPTARSWTRSCDSRG